MSPSVPPSSSNGAGALLRSHELGSCESIAEGALSPRESASSTRAATPRTSAQSERPRACARTLSTAAMLIVVRYVAFHLSLKLHLPGALESSHRLATRRLADLAPWRLGLNLSFSSDHLSWWHASVGSFAYRSRISVLHSYSVI